MPAPMTLVMVGSPPNCCDLFREEAFFEIGHPLHTTMTDSSQQLAVVEATTDLVEGGEGDGWAKFRMFMAAVCGLTIAAFVYRSLTAKQTENYVDQLIRGKCSVISNIPILGLTQCALR